MRQSVQLSFVVNAGTSFAPTFDSLSAVFEEEGAGAKSAVKSGLKPAPPATPARTCTPMPTLTMNEVALLGTHISGDPAA